ncbi:MAG: energy transducer TonB [Acidobacteriota bacterium]
MFAEDEFHPSEPALGSVSTRLPPPPIVVGKLAAITYSASVTSAAHIRTTGFDTAPIDVVPAAKPLEILFKPRPAYTDEARRLRIEGEVVLDVLFTASGEAHVQGVIQSLGHGLDESARESAAHIQFRPATRGGESIDQSAIVHIAFQLAY